MASKRNEKIYIQVADNISDQNTLKREVKPLLEIKSRRMAPAFID